MGTFTVAINVIFFIGITHVIPSIYAYGSGAPTEACNSLTPNHGASSQTSDSPYKVVLSKTSIHTNTPINITLTGREDFIGFLVQVRRMKLSEDDDVQSTILGGEFAAIQSADAKTLSCFSKSNSAVTHKNNQPKNNVVVQWIPHTPGQYKVHTTFVKTVNIFWVDQIDSKIIEVLPPNQQLDGHGRPISSSGDRATMCSTMKINPFLESEEGSSPYQVTIAPKANSSSAKTHNDPHIVYQKQVMWINVTSEYGTPLFKMFMQVRPKGWEKSSSSSKAVGKFIGLIHEKSTGPKQMTPEGGDVELVDCFGGKHNAILFVNKLHNRNPVSDVSILWEAPADDLGDFQVVATALSHEDHYFNKVVEDPDGRIKVIKKASTYDKNNKTSSSSNKNNETSLSSYSSSIKSCNGILRTTAIFALIFGSLKFI